MTSNCTALGGKAGCLFASRLGPRPERQIVGARLWKRRQHLEGLGVSVGAALHHRVLPNLLSSLLCFCPPPLHQQAPAIRGSLCRSGSGTTLQWLGAVWRSSAA